MYKTAIFNDIKCDPPLPKSMHNHSLWKNWDTIIDTALTKLQDYYMFTQQHGLNGPRPEIELIERNKTVGRFDFYNQWLRSFENWLNITSDKSDKCPPVYLPLALQSILEAAPRVKALSLFGRYMDSGPGAICNTLAAGLNQAPLIIAQEMKQGLS